MGHQLKLISVVIPAYNAALYIKKAIESALNQTYSNIEVIVVDDGSTDNTAQIVADFKHVKYVYQSNKGPSAARNLGIRLAKGEYIAILDSDDYCDPRRLSAQAQVLDHNDQIDFVYCDAHVVDGLGNVLYRLGCEHSFQRKEDALAHMLYRQFIATPATIMARRACFDVVPYPTQYVHAEDYYMLLKWAERYDGYYLSEPLYYYRRHNSNLTNAHDNQLRAEKEIVRSYGCENIVNAVMKSSFSYDEKQVLLSQIMLKIDLYKEALSSLEMVSSHSHLIDFLKGVSYFKLGHYSEALDKFKAVTSMYNDMAEGYNNAGCCYAMLLNPERASECFNKAIRLRSEYMDATMNKRSIIDGATFFRLTTRPLRKKLTTYI